MIQPREILTRATLAAILFASAAPGLTAQFRISDMGGIGDLTWSAFDPAIVYNSTDDEYLVVWHSDDDTGGLANDEFEIFGQLLSATGVEVSPNDFRISDMGGTGDAAYDAMEPAVAYNSTDNEYLVVWYGDDNRGGLIDGEDEVFGRLYGPTAMPLGETFRISDMGGTGDGLYYGAFSPAVAYNSQLNEYLVVWYGIDDTGGFVHGELEIFGQRIDAATGLMIGDNDFRISEAGGTGDAAYDTFDPAVAYNSVGNEYLVVWHGDDNTGGLIDGELEIFGRRVSGLGSPLGDQFRVSDMGGTGNTSYFATYPAVVYNAHENEFLVVWEGNDDTGGLAATEYEVFGQRIDAATGLPIGDNDFRISEAGGTGNFLYDASNPAVAYDGSANRYLVVWSGDDNVGGLVNDDFEIFGRYLTSIGAPIGDDVRISTMGGTGSAAFEALVPTLAFGSAAGEYLVAWYGDDDSGGQVDGEFEIFGARVRVLLFADGFETGDTVAWSAAAP